MLGGSAVYCVMKAGWLGASGGGGAKAAGSGAAAGNDDLKQRLNRLKAAQAAAT
jgi:hypothetical protein